MRLLLVAVLAVALCALLIVPELMRGAGEQPLEPVRIESPPASGAEERHEQAPDRERAGDRRSEPRDAPAPEDGGDSAAPTAPAPAPTAPAPSGGGDEAGSSAGGDEGGDTDRGSGASSPPSPGQDQPAPPPPAAPPPAAPPVPTDDGDDDDDDGEDDDLSEDGDD